MPREMSHKRYLTGRSSIVRELHDIADGISLRPPIHPRQSAVDAGSSETSVLVASPRALTQSFALCVPEQEFHQGRSDALVGRNLKASDVIDRSAFFRFDRQCHYRHRDKLLP